MRCFWLCGGWIRRCRYQRIWRRRRRRRNFGWRWWQQRWRRWWQRRRICWRYEQWRRWWWSQWRRHRWQRRHRVLGSALVRLMTDQPQPTNGNGLSGADMLALIAHMTDLLSKMEGRIMDRLSDNATGASERWATHKAEHQKELEDNTRRVVARFVALEEHLAEVEASLTTATAAPT